MIESILKGLELTDSNNELVQIAKGKYKNPESIKEAYEKLQQQIEKEAREVKEKEKLVRQAKEAKEAAEQKRKAEEAAKESERLN